MCTGVAGLRRPQLIWRSSSTPCHSGSAWMSHWIHSGYT